MDDLRSEIRAAFEKEQAGHAPAINMRHEVVRAAAVQPRREINLQWLAVAATFLIGALVVVSLMSTRIAQRVGPATSPHPSPAATPSGDYGPPPAGVNLIYVHDPHHPSWLIGFDWSGKPRATVKLDPAQTGVTMAPDGQTFAIGLYAKGGNWEFLDRLGAPIGGPSTLPGAINPMWADDNKHVCSITFDQQTYAWTLWTQLPGQAAKQVSVIARDTSIGQSGVGLVACSFRNGTAIAVRTVVAFPSEYWVIRLSNGKVQAHFQLAGGLSNIAASGDATLIAENSNRSTGQVGAPGSTVTSIRRASDGKLIASIDGAMGVLGFNSDNSAVLVTLAPWIGGQPAHLGIVAIASKQLVWNDDGTALFGGFVAEPGGRAFAISYPTTAQGPGPATIVLAGADGAGTKLDRVYAPTW